MQFLCFSLFASVVCYCSILCSQLFILLSSRSHNDGEPEKGAEDTFFSSLLSIGVCMRRLIVNSVENSIV